jgi:hydrogenase expression/formation protein HypE
MAAADVRLPAGKLPPDLLQRLLAHHAGGTDPRVLVGPGVGEDAAVLDVGPAAAGDATCLVAKSDPITFATERIGWYAVHVNANDIAAMGATPRWFLSTVILPQHLASEALVEQILQQIHEACASLGVLVVGGHTEITSGLDRPLVVGHMLGEAAPGQILRSSGLRPGDDVLLTKGVAIEATAILAREMRDDLRGRGWSDADIDAGAAFLTDPGISVVADARIARAAGGVVALHDPTEGGVATGLREMAQASGVGLVVDEEGLTPTPITQRLCAEYGLAPLGAISSGGLLIGCDAGATAGILQALADAGIGGLRVGVAGPAEGRLQLRRSNGSLVDLPLFPVDEIARHFAS